MEDRRWDVMISDVVPRRGRSGWTCPNFTLVGATTRTGLVAAPLRDRFGFIGQLDLYDVDELAVIAQRSAVLLEVDLRASSATIIASRSRGTPRIANRLLRRVRDFAAVQGHPVVNDAVAVEVLELFGVDEYGLDKIDPRILTSAVRAVLQPAGGPDHPRARLRRGTSHHRRRLRAVFVSRGTAVRTPRCRVATERAYRHLGVTPRSGGLF